MKTEDKQLDSLKQHASTIITVILCVLLAFFGWQYYQNHYAKIDTKAADLYATISSQNDEWMLVHQNSDVDNTASQASLLQNIDMLMHEHKHSFYAWQAAMIKARILADTNDLAGSVVALDEAKAVANVLNDEALIAITLLQKAHVHLAQNDFEAAKKVLDYDFADEFSASKQEVLGDIHLAQNNKDAAKSAYQTAYDLLTKRDEKRALLYLKMQDLGMQADTDAQSVAVVDTSQIQLSH